MEPVSVIGVPVLDLSKQTGVRETAQSHENEDLNYDEVIGLVEKSVDKVIILVSCNCKPELMVFIVGRVR